MNICDGAATYAHFDSDDIEMNFDYVNADFIA